MPDKPQTAFKMPAPEDKLALLALKKLLDSHYFLFDYL